MTTRVYVPGSMSLLRELLISGGVIALVGFVLTWFVPERQLRESIAAVAGDVGKEAEEIFPMPTDASSLARLERGSKTPASRRCTPRLVRASARSRPATWPTKPIVRR